MSKRRSGSAFVYVLLVAAVLVYLLLPLAKGLYERVYFSHIRQRAVTMLDMAAFSAVLELDADAFSERRMILDEEAVKAHLVDPEGVIVPTMTWVEQEGNSVKIGFTFRFPRVFSDTEAELKVEGMYDFEVLNSPVY